MTDRNAQKGNSQNQGNSNPQGGDDNRKAGSNRKGDGKQRSAQPAPPGAGGDARPKDQPGDAPGNNRKGGGGGQDDRGEKLSSGSARLQNADESGRSSDGDGMDKDGGRSGRESKNQADRGGRDDASRSGHPGR